MSARACAPHGDGEPRGPAGARAWKAGRSGRGQEENILSLCDRKLNSGAARPQPAYLKARQLPHSLAEIPKSLVLCVPALGSEMSWRWFLYLEKNSPWQGSDLFPHLVIWKIEGISYKMQILKAGIDLKYLDYYTAQILVSLLVG